MMAGMGLLMPFGEMDRRMGLQMPSEAVTESCQEWAYGCHLETVMDSCGDGLIDAI